MLARTGDRLSRWKQGPGGACRGPEGQQGVGAMLGAEGGVGVLRAAPRADVGLGGRRVTKKRRWGGRAPTPSLYGAPPSLLVVPAPDPSGPPAPTPSMASRVKPGPGISPSPPPPPRDQHTVPMETKQKRWRPPPCQPCPASPDWLRARGLRVRGRAPGCGGGNDRPRAQRSAVILGGCRL